MNASNLETPDRNLAMKLVRITESAALAAGQWVNRGQKEKGDGAAVDAMHQLIDTVVMNDVVVTSEGGKGETPILFNGEKAGNGQDPAINVAVDPINGTTLMTKGCLNSIAILAAVNHGSTCDPSAVLYMDKTIVDPEAADKIDVETPAEHNIKIIVKTKGLCPEDVAVVVLDRPHHTDMIRDIRGIGARIQLIGDGDVASTITAAQNTNLVDIMMGVGDTPEDIITACAMKYMGGEIQDKLYPRDEAEVKKALDIRHDLFRVLTADDLAASDSCYFVAAGVTNGDMLRDVAHRGNGTWTRSLVIRSKSGTIRRIEAFHSLEESCKYTSIDYDKGEMPDIDP